VRADPPRGPAAAPGLGLGALGGGWRGAAATLTEPADTKTVIQGGEEEEGGGALALLVPVHLPTACRLLLSAVGKLCSGD